VSCNRTGEYSSKLEQITYQRRSRSEGTWRIKGHQARLLQAHGGLTGTWNAILAAMKRELHIPSLDGIRGMAALTVFVSHAGLQDIVPGGFGVTIFFFLSGYLITTLLRREYEQSGTISFRRFYMRRILRIIPPMYIVLTIGLLLALAKILPSGMTPAGVIAQYAHLTNYYYIVGSEHHLVPSTTPMWSLAVEEHFYLLFPLALYAMFNRRWSYQRMATAFLITCVVVLSWRLYVVYELGLGHSYTYLATDTRLDSLLYGCIMGVWWNPALDSGSNRLGTKAWAGLLGLGIACLLVSFLIRDEGFRETGRYTVQGIGLFAVFYCAVRFSHWPIFSWLQSPIARGLGLISYTFYLCHPMILRLINLYVGGPRLWQAALGLAGTIAFSTAMYYGVERRLASLRKRLHRADSANQRSGSIQEIPVGPQTAAVKET
jgi:peptidoglycan/LPS O-acetylase OafA/YrhL